MTVYVEIAVNVPRIAGVFHYHLPDELEGQVGRGHLVIVPFGRQEVQGVVLRQVETPSVPKTRPVTALLDPQPVVTPAQIALAEHLAGCSLAPLAACITLMLPPGLSQMADTLYTLTPGGEAANANDPALTAPQQRLLALLQQRGPLRGRQIDHALPRKRWQATARALQRRGLLTSCPVLPPPQVRPKTERIIALAVPPEEARARLDELGRVGSRARERRQEIIHHLIASQAPLPARQLYAETGGEAGDLRSLAERGLIIIREQQVWRDPLSEHEFIPAEPPRLTRDQQAVWEQVRRGIERSAAGGSVAPYLLYGVTGSGKTEIYLRAVEAVLQQGRQAIVLVPEIALTPQTVGRFLARFPGKVGLVHSRLSAGERYDTWRRARAGELSVVVGPRSALFTPFDRLGLIVVDECHDDSYYQSESAPHYHARELATAYAVQVGAVCLMGSATPDVVSTYRAAHGVWTPLRLPERILAHKGALARWQAAGTLKGGSHYRPLEHDAETIDLPPVRVVDMRAELKEGNTSIFSRALHTALSTVLDAGQQAILFVNRRGMATYVFCRECGHTLKCPRCDTPLTYHVEAGEALLCHRCNYRRKLPPRCPQCRSPKIRHYGLGTERVEAEVRAIFPAARTLRWDWGTTRKKGAHERILQCFARREADVLIGTQMLAKGLDLPLVTLVGVVLADVGLNLPDYRAGERVFQVLTQVSGRAGRSPLGGEVILQTFQPEHYVIQAAAGHSYADFYRQELAYRRELGYPPFARLARLEFRGEEEAEVQRAAEETAALLRKRGLEHHEMIGPAPSFFQRVGGTYRWQIVLRGQNPLSLLRAVKLPECRVEVDPPSLL